jgi:hypothetical protein
MTVARDSLMTGSGLVMPVLVPVQTNVGLVDDSKDFLMIDKLQEKFGLYSLGMHAQ